MTDLRALAESATPGPWRVGRNEYIEHPSTDRNDYPTDGWAYLHWDAEGLGGIWRHDEDAAYIAAASPDVILSLLDRVERAEAAAHEATTYLGWLEKWVHANPGHVLAWVKASALRASLFSL